MNERMYIRGEIYLADFSDGVGSEQKGARPVCIIQNDIGNRFSPCVIVASITSKIEKCKLPTHVLLTKDQHGMPRNSVLMLEHIRSIDKSRLMDKITTLDNEAMKKVNNAISISLGLVEMPKPAAKPRTQQTPRKPFIMPIPVTSHEPVAAFA